MSKTQLSNDAPETEATELTKATRVSSPAKRPSARPTSSTPDDDLQPGTEVSRYVIESELGAGGMGVVYRARDPELARPIAIKLLITPEGTPEEHQVWRLRHLREAQAMARLSHPNVVTVHDVGVHHGKVFIAMELVEGQTLSAWLKEERRAWQDILDLFLHAGKGLAAAHSAGLVHRDFKPSNVLVGNDGRVRVLDFGLARTANDTLDAVPQDEEARVAAVQKRAAQLEEMAHASEKTVSARGPGYQKTPVPPSEKEHKAAGKQNKSSADDTGTGSARAMSTLLTHTGMLMGTPRYMSPEQHLCQPTDARTDQYSFCLALYEAIYRELPFSPLAPLERLSGKIRPAPQATTVPLTLRHVVLKGLAVLADDRYADLEALFVALEQSLPRPKKRSSAPKVVLGLALLAAVAGAYVVMQDSPQPEPPLASELAPAIATPTAQPTPQPIVAPSIDAGVQEVTAAAPPDAAPAVRRKLRQKRRRRSVSKEPATQTTPLKPKSENNKGSSQRRRLLQLDE